MIKPIKKRYLKKWLQDKKYLYPVFGFLVLIWFLLVIPFVALWEFRGEAASAISGAVALMLCKVEDDDS